MLSLMFPLALALDMDAPPPFEVSLLAGIQNAHDPRFGTLSQAGSLSGLGVRAAWSPHPNVAVVLDWQADRSLMTLYANDETYYDYSSTGTDTGTGSSGTGTDTGSSGSGGDINIAFSTHQIALGARGQLRIGRFFQPYAIAQGLILADRVRLDDDPDHDDNLTQQTHGGVGLGVYGALGAAFPIARRSRMFAVAPFLELGYGHIFDHQVGSLGELSFYGIAGRIGVGLRF
jgi:hypothetical protein